MSYDEALQPCAIYAERTAADAALEVLARHGIVGAIESPGARTHGLAEGSFQVSVPGTEASRARALLSNEPGA
ncbi:MAG: hypothetical protein OEQ13_07420 [Acidobacteriota bacterium]|nr:hypothetical protein [Acidobacteriota bacterium]